MNKLLNEDWIDSLPNDTVEHFESINKKIIEVICNRIKTIGSMSATDIHKLTNAVEFLGADMQEIEKTIAKETGKSRKTIAKMLESVVEENDNWARVFYEARGMEAVNLSNSLTLQLLTSTIEIQTNNIFKNLSNTTALYLRVGKQTLLLRDAYIKVIDRAMYSVQSGVLPYSSAIRPLVKQFGKGIVTYQSGYKRRSDSVLRQIILDGVRELNQQVMNYHGQQYGADGVEISAHAISAPDHIFVQGHQFSNEEYAIIQSGVEGKFVEDVNGKIYKTFKRPIGLWNCRHIALPIIIGVSERSWSDEQLRNFRFNSKEKYEKTQKMRQMESKIRTLKQERDVYKQAGLIDEYRKKREETTILTKKYRRYALENDLEEKPFNLRA